MDLTNQFLIAMPALQDPNFHRTVTYLCAHNNEGAMGIVINRPLDLNLGDVLDHMSIEVDNIQVNDMMVLQGGPVQRDRGFVIHEPAGEWDAVLTVGDDIGVATSRDILTAVAHGDGPKRAVVALGYAGWGAGQLEHEVLQNAWLSGPADSSIIFDLPYEERYESAARLLGVDLDRLSGEAGHA
jgi:putative transcriptional regulator